MTQQRATTLLWMADRLRACRRTLPRRAPHGLLLQRVLQAAGGRLSRQPRLACRWRSPLFNSIGALWIPGTGMLIDRFGAKRVILVSTAAASRWSWVASLWVGTEPVAALSPVLAAGHLHGQWPGARAIWRGHLALVRSPSRTRVGALHDGNRHWVDCCADTFPAADCGFWMAHGVRDLRRGDAGDSASDCCCPAAGRPVRARPSSGRRRGTRRSSTAPAGRGPARPILARDLA